MVHMVGEWAHIYHPKYVPEVQVIQYQLRMFWLFNGCPSEFSIILRIIIELR